MKRSKNPVALILMASSIALLLVLQFLWLRNSYNKAFDEFNRETNMLFRNTVLAMRDSMIERSIELVPGDTLAVKNRRHHWFDSVRLRGQTSDTLIDRAQGVERISRVEVMVTPMEPDSLDHMIKPLVSRFYNSRSRGNFIFRLGPDSLTIDSVHRHFEVALSAAGIELPFQVIPMKRGEHPQQKIDQWLSEPVHFSPLHRYVVAYAGVKGLLFRSIIPQILFAVFLTTLTIVAFYLMYRSLRKEQRMADLKNDFISNVTHELKTPITTVRVALEALQDFNGLNNPAVTREYLTIAQNELNRLSMLTDNVLRTAIFETSGVLFRPEKIDVWEIVERVQVSMKPVFEKCNASVTTEQEGEDFSVSGSVEHLTNVICNLLDNALKYSPASPEIAIVVKGEKARVVIMVQDKGIGIPLEFHDKIFEKFFRVPTGDVHTVKGYGLGLSYVASVIHSHGGTIRVESEPGAGSCFIVELPRHEKD